jgi:ABC-type uncharacterized transport system substrate-binding protein
MRRRGFIAAIAGVVAATQTLRPRVVFAQAEKTRRIGLLMGWSEGNSDFRGFVATLADELARLGWIDGRNARIEQRWTNADVNRARAFAQELLATQPDVIVTSTTHATAAAKRESNTIPIVFTVVSDPVGSGFVAALPRPGGNITGFSHTDGGLGGKWLTLLKEIAPDIKRAGIMFNPDTAPSGGKFFLGSFEASAAVLGVEPVTLPVRIDRVCQKRRPAVLRGRHQRYLSPCRWLRRSRPARRETGRPAGTTTDQIRHGDQSQNCQIARRQRAARAHRDRR